LDFCARGSGVLDLFQTRDEGFVDREILQERQIVAKRELTLEKRYL
jgi:hypothetical protein